MRTLSMLCFILFSNVFSAIAQFGNFASAVYLSVDNGATKSFYNTLALTGDANAIGSLNFSDPLGSFAANSGKLQLHGAEVKTFKANNGNVCAAKLYYRVYLTNNNPNGPFALVNLPFFANCIDGVFQDGKGSCSSGDQKWQRVDAAIDLTQLPAGEYTLELYYQFEGGINPGSNEECSMTRYDSKDGANHKTNFTIEESLPVQLLNFNGKFTSEGILLNWSTASESNNRHFAVMHSGNGKDFTTLGTVKGKGNTAVGHAYSFLHTLANSGNHYYRLKQVDTDGTGQLSKIIKVEGVSTSRLSIYPNPAKEFVQINGLQPADQLMLLDRSGRILRNIKTTGSSLKVSVHNLPAGQYFISTGSTGSRKQLSFVKE